MFKWIVIIILGLMVFNISDKIEDLTKKVNKLESQYKGVDSTYVNPYGMDTTIIIIEKVKE